MKTEYLLTKQVDRVLAALMPANRLAMRVALHTGLRIGDVLSLESAKLASRMWVKEAKTGKRRLIGLPSVLLAEMRLSSGGTKWVFPSPRDPRKHRTRQAVWADVKRAARAFRLPQNVGPHSARKVYAVDLLERYGDIDRVRRALNHRDVTTTLIYAMADKLLHSTQRVRLRGQDV